MGGNSLMLAVAVATALGAGVLVGVSRAVNGRLAQSAGALRSSLWNHVVGLAVLACFALALRPPGLAEMADAPLWAWAGGPVGVLFVASGSVLIARIGAARTAILVIAGQMVFGLVLDALLRGPSGTLPKALGAALIVAGVVLVQARPAKDR